MIGTTIWWSANCLMIGRLSDDRETIWWSGQQFDDWETASRFGQKSRSGHSWEAQHQILLKTRSTCKTRCNLKCTQKAHLKSEYYCGLSFGCRSAQLKDICMQVINSARLKPTSNPDAGNILLASNYCNLVVCLRVTLRVKQHKKQYKS